MGTVTEPNILRITTQNPRAPTLFFKYVCFLTECDASKMKSIYLSFKVWVKQSDRASGLSTNVKVAKMSLIDLAGSERGCATGLSGERFREGNNINRSLLALGNLLLHY